MNQFRTQHQYHAFMWSLLCWSLKVFNGINFLFYHKRKKMFKWGKIRENWTDCSDRVECIEKVDNSTTTKYNKRVNEKVLICKKLVGQNINQCGTEESVKNSSQFCGLHFEQWVCERDTGLDGEEGLYVWLRICVGKWWMSKKRKKKDPKALLLVISQR